MAWFQNNANGRSVKKSQYYVWYLGAKEADGLRGKEHVIPVMRQLLKESLRRFPNKITVQVSQKGLKLIQTVPTMSKSGKLKTELIKFQIPQHSITFSMVGPPPFTDIVGCILLVFNPETKSPVHVHCYRCDSPETAAFMNANLQALLNRPETQKRLLELERRLTMTGLLAPTPEVFGANRHRHNGTHNSDFAAAATRHIDRSVFAVQPQPDNNRPQKAVDASVAAYRMALLEQAAAARVKSRSQSDLHFMAARSRRSMAMPIVDNQSSDEDEMDDSFDMHHDWTKHQHRQKHRHTVDPEKRLKKDLFYELRDRLNTKPSDHHEIKPHVRSNKHQPFDYYIRNGGDQPSPLGAKDSSNTSTTSGLGSDFSGGGGVSGSMQHQHHSSDVQPDRRRLSVAELHRAWRVDNNNTDVDDRLTSASTPLRQHVTNRHAAKRYQQKSTAPHVITNHLEHNSAMIVAGGHKVPTKELRMFGDTLLKPGVAGTKLEVGNEKPMVLSELKHQRARSRQWRSVDNLQIEYEASLTPDFATRNPIGARVQAVPMPTSTENDQFWQKRRSCFLPDGITA